MRKMSADILPSSLLKCQLSSVEGEKRLIIAKRTLQKDRRVGIRIGNTRRLQYAIQQVRSDSSAVSQLVKFAFNRFNATFGGKAQVRNACCWSDMSDVRCKVRCHSTIWASWMKGIIVMECWGRCKYCVWCWATLHDTLRRSAMSHDLVRCCMMLRDVLQCCAKS